MPPEPSTQMALGGRRAGHLEARCAHGRPGDPARPGRDADPSRLPAPPCPSSPPPRAAGPATGPGPAGGAAAVKRIVRRVELWSVLKLVLIFFLCMYAVGLVTMAVLWGFANSAGLVDNFESFATRWAGRTGSSTASEMFRQAAVIGAVLVVAATLLSVLATALLNLISELTGRHPARRHRGGRRAAARRPPDPGGPDRGLGYDAPSPGL